MDARRSDGACVKLRPGSMASLSVVWLDRAMAFLPLAIRHRVAHQERPDASPHKLAGRTSSRKEITKLFAKRVPLLRIRTVPIRFRQACVAAGDLHLPPLSRSQGPSEDTSLSSRVLWSALESSPVLEISWKRS